MTPDQWAAAAEQFLAALQTIRVCYVDANGAMSRFTRFALAG